MEAEMLHEGKTIEVEILEFKSGGKSYGINVNEIREILAYDRKTTPVPNAHPFIEGILMPRDFIITVLDFKKCFQLSDVEDVTNEMLIITRINNLNIALHVDSVNGIHRSYIEDITKPEASESLVDEFISGILVNENNQIEIVDLIKLFQHINPSVSLA